MKKNTVKLFILAAMLGGSLSAHAQVNHARVAMKEADVKRLIENGNEAKRQFDVNYAEAVRLAEINNWPLFIKHENGGVSALTRVEKGMPVYVGTNNVGSAITSRTNHLQPGGSLNLNLTGSFGQDDPMYVGVWDGGYPRSSHHDLANRTQQQTAGTLGVDLHPTHVTGTIIGSGVSAAAAKGMAPGAFSLNSDYLADEGEMDFFAASGYILSNHSYGLDPSQLSDSQLDQWRGSYISESRGVDVITYNAPYYLPVYAAGNDGDGFSYDRLTDRATSKNNLVVAAVAEVDDYEGPISVQITNFSSWGPTNDHRIKPDISTKGLNVYSCSDANDTAHVSEQGTSMATPGITGSLVLLQQYYSNLHPSGQEDQGIRNFMKSATVRALVAHSADEAGLADGPDPVYGWGLMNSKRAAEIIKADHDNTNAEIHELVLTSGQTYTYNVTANGTEPLIATIAWTDPAGNVTTNVPTAVLVNNLDIKIKKGNTVYYPWRLDEAGQYAENIADNDVDNIEKVEVPNAASGVYTITVSHKKATLKNPNGGPTEQAYSLIISGVTGVPAGLDDVNQKAFTVWPNPANNVINISFGNGIEQGASATFYDVQGRLVKTAKLTGVDNAIDVQDLAKGLYVVSVANGGKTEIEKIIIK